MTNKRIQWSIVGLDYAPSKHCTATYTLIPAALFFAWLFANFGVYNFSLWPQVEYLGVLDVSAWQLIGEFHPHALRYTLVRPVYLIESHFGINRQITYNMLASFVLLCIPVYIYSYLNRLRVESKRIVLWGSLFLITYFLLGKYMHGRIIWAHAGILMTITAPLFYRETFFSGCLLFLHLAVAMLMASVSSGALTVQYLALVLIACIYIKRSFDSKKILYARIIPILAVLMIFLPWTIVGVFKNVNFYGGGVNGIVAMADHGNLSIFEGMDKLQEPKLQEPKLQEPKLQEPNLEDYKAAILGMSLLPLLIFVRSIEYAKETHIEMQIPAAWIALLIALLIGQVGYSTLTLAIPLLMCVLATYKTSLHPFQK